MVLKALGVTRWCRTVHAKDSDRQEIYPIGGPTMLDFRAPSSGNPGAPGTLTRLATVIGTDGSVVQGVPLRKDAF